MPWFSTTCYLPIQCVHQLEVGYPLFRYGESGYVHNDSLCHVPCPHFIVSSDLFNSSFFIRQTAAYACLPHTSGADSICNEMVGDYRAIRCDRHLGNQYIHYLATLYMGYELVSQYGRKGTPPPMTALPLPKSFDANEWFIIVGLIVGYTMIILLRKRFPTMIFVLVFLFSITVAKLFDATLGVPPFELYDINDWPKLDLMDILIHLLYPPFAYLFVYLYDMWRIRGIYVLVYILLFTSFGVALEWFGTLCGVYHYKEWNLLYSFTVYMCNQILLLLFFRMLMNHYQETKNKTAPKGGLS